MARRINLIHSSKKKWALPSLKDHGSEANNGAYALLQAELPQVKAWYTDQKTGASSHWYHQRTCRWKGANARASYSQTLPGEPNGRRKSHQTLNKKEMG